VVELWAASANATSGRLELARDLKSADDTIVVQAIGGMPSSDLQSRNFMKARLQIQLFDEFAQRVPLQWRKAWRGFLRLGNLFQFFDHFEFVTSLGLIDDLYSPLSQVEQTPLAGSDAQIDALLENVAPELRNLCSLIANEKKQLPELGFELTNSEGKIIAMAELVSCAVS